MARISESFADHGPLVDRSRDEDVDVAVLYVVDGPVEGGHRRLGGLRRRLARLNEHVLRQAVDDVYPLRVHVLRRIDDVGAHLLDVVDLLPVESEYL